MIDANQQLTQDNLYSDIDLDAAYFELDKRGYFELDKRGYF
ncbi:MAG: hypothetical protein ACR5LF_08065 [Symbiopectobacterium sp.]